MFNFSKKQAEIAEPIMEEVTEEQLGLVTGGSGVVLGLVSGLTGGLTGDLTGNVLNSVSVSPLTVQVGGISVNTPAITPTSLLP